MNTQWSLSRNTIAEQFSEIYRTGRMTMQDLNSIESLQSWDILDEEDKNIIDRLLHAVRRGWLEVVDA